MALQSGAVAPAERYDVALLDLDGVVYIGSSAVPGARDALASARRKGMRLAFVTNNASRTPSAVAELLTGLGIAASPDEVVTSAQAAAHFLADRLPVGAAVLVLGTTGLIEALHDRGLRPVFSADDDPAAVVQGYSPDLDWYQLAEGAVAINRGVLWVATNLDPTVPSARGRVPGNGSMVAALRHATGATPVSTGKPDPTMHLETVERSGARHPIVVGDRLDTDIVGATRVGCDSLLVLTGVTSSAELLAATPDERPDYVAANLRGLLEQHPLVEVTSDGARCRGWHARRAGAVVRLISSTSTSTSSSSTSSSSTSSSSASSSSASSSSTSPSSSAPAQYPSSGAVEDAVDALRALCGACWADGRPLDVQADDDTAQEALEQLGLHAGR